MRYFFFIFVFISSMNVHSTELIELIVYHQQQYHQGPWSLSDQLDDDGNYLMPFHYNVMSDNNPCTPAELVMERLADDKPDLYLWNYALDCPIDTTVIYPDVDILDPIVFNEMVASLCELKGSNYLKIVLDNEALVFNKSDIDIPYFNLTLPNASNASEDDEFGAFRLTLLFALGILSLFLMITIIYWKKKN